MLQNYYLSNLILFLIIVSTAKLNNGSAVL